MSVYYSEVWYFCINDTWIKTTSSSIMTWYFYQGWLAWRSKWMTTRGLQISSATKAQGQTLGADIILIYFENISQNSWYENRFVLLSYCILRSLINQSLQPVLLKNCASKTNKKPVYITQRMASRRAVNKGPEIRICPGATLHQVSLDVECNIKWDSLCPSGTANVQSWMWFHVWSLSKQSAACTWTMSLSAYLPLDEIRTSSPSNSTIAEEEKKTAEKKRWERKTQI